MLILLCGPMVHPENINLISLLQIKNKVVQMHYLINITQRQIFLIFNNIIITTTTIPDDDVAGIVAAVADGDRSIVAVEDDERTRGVETNRPNVQNQQLFEFTNLDFFYQFFLLSLFLFELSLPSFDSSACAVDGFLDRLATAIPDVVRTLACQK